MARLLDGQAVARLLTLDLALDSMRRCFHLEGEGRAGGYGRLDVSHSAGWFRVLPAVFEGLGVFGLKTITLTQGLGVRYAITVHDLESGELRAVLDAEAITGARTGATAAVAAELLCLPSVEKAAIVGTGSVARTQLPALQAVRPASRIAVYSRNPENRGAFIREMDDQVDAVLVDCASPEEAMEGASLVTLATKASRPIMSSRHLRPGVHVSSVGAARPDLMEVDPVSFPAFDLVVCDAVDLVFSEAGDAVAARESGYPADRAAPLGAVVAGNAPSRTGPEQVTLFKSTGTGLQDLALSVAVLEAAEAEGIGEMVDDLLTLKRFGPTGRT